ncbi:hypothetical protein [Sphingomonas japonica]|uniref:Uncharacterized protein n=1 Tax=Sphingomonas japonica TaxID=511662 RepID=A0ABX0U2N3_9SPHN|nr:hypothetical protein [Sphingomonas japonica]NIJ24748.1 hypothetical protein [Sphingomonas japonica]
MKTSESPAMFASFALALLCSAALVSSAVAPAEAIATVVPVGQVQA